MFKIVPNKDMADQLEEDLAEVSEVDPIKVLVGKYSKDVEFVDPQSMNYDIKLNYVY